MIPEWPKDKLLYKIDKVATLGLRLLFTFISNDVKYINKFYEQLACRKLLIAVKYFY